MLSPRRCAQLGLGAAGVVMLASMTVLIAGAADGPTAPTAGTPHRAALTDGSLAVLPTPGLARLPAAKH